MLGCEKKKSTIGGAQKHGTKRTQAGTTLGYGAGRGEKEVGPKQKEESYSTGTAAPQNLRPREEKGKRKEKRRVTNGRHSRPTHRINQEAICKQQ